MAAGSERVLLFQEALEEVLRVAGSLSTAAADPLRAETLTLLQTRGRILAEPVCAERDQPPFSRSTRDGFALRTQDLAAGQRELRIVGAVRAGERWAGTPLGPGDALEIMTGAPVPESADAVLMVEHARVDAEGTLVPEPGRRLSPGENIVPRGAEALAQAELVPAGRLIGAAEIALAATCGRAELRVYRPPRVAILATGDELVDLTETPEPWQIRNSNTYALAALIAAEGGEPLCLPVARDNRDDLHRRIAEGRKADLLLLSGGVSMGKYDLVEQALEEAGAGFLFTGARIQPGKPVVFGRLPADGGQTCFFGLPGNPISTEVCFRLFVAPLLRALVGRKDLSPQFAEARLSEDLRGARVTRFLPAEISGDWQGSWVRSVPWQGSGDLAANGRANGFVVLPLERESFHAGETVRVLLR